MTRTIKLSDHETEISDQGTGDTVVLIHAIGLDHHMWDAVAAKLSSTHRVIAVDLRGHGAAANAPLPLTLEKHASDVNDLVTALGLERVHIAGLSYGGAVAQMTVLAKPERFTSLAIAASMMKGVPDAFLGRAEAAERDGVPAQVDTTLARWFSAEQLAANPPFVDYARKRVGSDKVENWASAWRALANMDTTGRLGELTMPAAVIAGENDVSTTPASMQKIAEGLPNATYTVIPAGVHMLSLENSAALTDVLRAHLTSAAKTAK